MRTLFSRALQVDPLSPFVFTLTGWLFVLAGRFEESLSRFQRALELKPGYPIAQWVMGHAFAHLGYVEGDFPVSERVAARCLSLPMFPGMTPEQIDAVVTGVGAFFDG